MLEITYKKEKFKLKKKLCTVLCNNITWAIFNSDSHGNVIKKRLI